MFRYPISDGLPLFVVVTNPADFTYSALRKKNVLAKHNRKAQKHYSCWIYVLNLFLKNVE